MKCDLLIRNGRETLKPSGLCRVGKTLLSKQSAVYLIQQDRYTLLTRRARSSVGCSPRNTYVNTDEHPPTNTRLFSHTVPHTHGLRRAEGFYFSLLLTNSSSILVWHFSKLIRFIATRSCLGLHSAACTTAVAPLPERKQRQYKLLNGILSSFYLCHSLINKHPYFRPMPTDFFLTFNC